ncbi:MAG: hypothetical protein IPF66_16465 [Holophagales bacterium]|nr:hypothetical protein [Holophagales bacterium]
MGRLLLPARTGQWTYARIHADRLVPEAIPATEFLRFKEGLVTHADAEDPLELDFGPFSRGFPRLTEPRSIGQGSRSSTGTWPASSSATAAPGRPDSQLPRPPRSRGRSLLLRVGFPDNGGLRSALRKGTRSSPRPETPWSGLEERLAGLGFAPGWGATAGAPPRTMSLIDLFEAPRQSSSSVPRPRPDDLASSSCLPHGWFRPVGVLGLPDTGRQVVYILDQVRALEREMRDRMAAQGVDVEPRIVVVTRLIPEAGSTGCDERLEPIDGCRSAVILRVPFREADGSVVRSFLSRFKVWPYLPVSRARSGAGRAEMGGRPDLILGNYSDGSLVAALIGMHPGVTRASIATLTGEDEVPPLSALHWRR